MNVVVNFPDELIKKILLVPNPRELPFDFLVGSLLEKALGEPAKAHYTALTLSQMLDIAVNAMREKSAGERCTLQSLLVDQAWDSLSDGDKRMLGKQLRVAIEKEKLAEIEKTTSNLAIYTRI